MKKLNKLVYIPFVFALSSCGFGLKEYYRGDAYVSGDFQKDYYEIWNEKIDVRSGKSLVKSTETYALDASQDYVFTEYDDPNFRLVDSSSAKSLTYEDDYYPNDENKYLNKGFGPTKKCSRLDDSFRYGYLSKLFDGQMFCHSRYQYARVQIKESGFGALFNKETNLDTYFALNFKASYDYTKYEEVDFLPYYEGASHVPAIPNVPNGIKSAVNLKISFFCKEDKGYVKKTFTYPVSDIVTNGSENPAIYTFFGFSCRRYSLSRVAGFSIEFDFDRDDINANPMKELKDKKGNPYALDYSLMLYEVFMPNTTWR